MSRSKTGSDGIYRLHHPRWPTQREMCRAIDGEKRRVSGGIGSAGGDGRGGCGPQRAFVTGAHPDSSRIIDIGVNCWSRSASDPSRRCTRAHTFRLGNRGTHAAPWSWQASEGFQACPTEDTALARSKDSRLVRLRMRRQLAQVERVDGRWFSVRLRLGFSAPPSAITRSGFCRRRPL
jgi:hypothetical protein